MLLPLILTLAMQAAAPSPVVVIARDAMSNVDSPRQAVARDTAEWAALWRRHAGDSPAPKVDFTARTVVAVFLGSRPSAGFAVEIIGTRQASGTLIVRWQERRPSRDEVSAQVLTSPAVIASIPKFTGEITFEKVEP
jgi:hypothetical protein